MSNIKKVFICLFLFLFVTVVVLEDLLYLQDLKNSDFVTWDYGISQDNDRLEQGIPYDKKKSDIVVIGCSYAYGDGLDNIEDTFAYKLQKATGRRVFNRGYSRTGVQHVLWQIENADFFKRDDINPEYVIYIYIPDHLRKMYINYFGAIDVVKYMRYEKNYNGLELKSMEPSVSDWFKQLQVYKFLNEQIIKLKLQVTKYNFLDIHLMKAKRTLNKKYPDAKFVILLYNQDISAYSIGFNLKLKKEGFTVLNFSGRQYAYLNKHTYKADGFNPNGKAWDEIVPVVKEKLKL